MSSNADTLRPTHYVAVGASAGGLEAIEAFFSRMPQDTSFGFVVVQHLSPDYKSLMVEILSKKTSITVQRAEDGMVVRPANIYLIPPKKNLTIYHGTLMLAEQDHARGLNLPIDVFLRSLAEDQGERAVAVILSGTGSDGMRGVRAVKQAGGMILVQDEESARFDGMPRAAASTGLADFILPPSEMPRELLAFTRHPYVNRAQKSESIHANEDTLTRIFALLRERSKVDFSHYKPSTVIRRIERRIGITQTDDIDAYLSFVHAQPMEIDILFRELLIGVTSFFRDPQVFEFLEHNVLPELLDRRSDGDIRVWVAGCSTGEEAYTLAILIRESLMHLNIAREVKIFATDIDRDAVRHAATGVYPESIAADVPPHLLARYFIRQDDRFRISRSVREMVVFAQHNLIKDPPFTRIDLISCRNLLIYFQPVLQNMVLENFSFSLNEDGVLLLGTSESTGEMSSHFEVVESRLKVFRTTSRGPRTPQADRQRGEPAAPVRSAENRFLELQRRYGGGRRRNTAVEERVLERFLDVAGSRFMPLTVIVNEEQQVLHIIGDSSLFFRFPSGKPTIELGKVAVPQLSIPLTTGITKVLREQKELRFEGVTLDTDDRTVRVNLDIIPLPHRSGQEALVAVFLDSEDVEHQEGDEERKSNIATWDLSREAEQRIRDLEQELQLSRENLQATVEELETSNEELQATNEELLASNEELQSTNEELQSTNEELYTVNAEYHGKIMELTELTNDVDNLLTTARIGTLILDDGLTVRRFSQELGSIFNLRTGDVGRPINHIAHRITGYDPLHLIEQVQKSSEPAEKEVQTEEGAWYLMRVVPYAVSNDEFSGVVVTMVDITTIRETQQLLQTVANASPALIWISDETGGCTWFNEPWLTYRGRTTEEEEGLGWLEGVHHEDRDRCMEVYQEHFTRRDPFSMEYRLQRFDGEWRWFLDSGAPRYDTRGEFAGYIGTCLDITERRELEERLHTLTSGQNTTEKSEGASGDGSTP